MDDSYIISFINGSSGRFLKHILYSLITDNKEELELTEVNSAHIQNFFTGVEFASSIGPGKESIYKTLEFDTNLPKDIPNILGTHQYPDFELITKRLPNTKVILINIEEDDWLEVIGNTVYKNGISILTRNNNNEYLSDHEISYLPWLKDLYRTVLDTDFNKPFKYDIKDTEKIVYALRTIWKKYQIENKTVPNFLNSILNLENYSNLTVIDYKELYNKTVNGKYAALEKLENLTNKVANFETLKNYEKYVIGRDKFIQKAMPWLLKENPNN